MTGEFDHVRAAFSRSLPARVVSAGAAVVIRAWRSSALHRLVSFAKPTRVAATLVEVFGIAVFIAAVMQPVLIVMMPATVAPAFPWWGYLLIALLAALMGWQAEMVVTAWPTSRLRRLIHLARRSVLATTDR